MTGTLCHGKDMREKNRNLDLHPRSCFSSKFDSPLQFACSSFSFQGPKVIALYFSEVIVIISRRDGLYRGGLLTVPERNWKSYIIFKPVEQAKLKQHSVDIHRYTIKLFFNKNKRMINATSRWWSPLREERKQHQAGKHGVSEFINWVVGSWMFMCL